MRGKAVTRRQGLKRHRELSFTPGFPTHSRGLLFTPDTCLDDKSAPQNENIEFVTIDIDQDGFFKKFLFTHFFTVYIAYYLGRLADAAGRDLISIAASDPWWGQRSIELFPQCADIPSVPVA
ncbi:hypothetical protein [Kutzneria sp. NPDC052558]|uniref:hypothetical protein n=1 Tax=Kutzneria sp. NPDC052558 TaxID=3364121 RepID=UPI0037C7555A